MCAQYSTDAPPKRVCADAHSCGSDRVDIDDVLEVADVDVAEVVGAERVQVDIGVAHPSDALESGRDERIRTICDPSGRVGIGRSTVRRVVLEAAVARRVVRWSDHDPVTAGRVIERQAAVVGEDRVAEGGRRHPRIAGVESHVDPVGDQHLDGTALGGK